MPRDPNQLAKMVVDMTLGEAEPEPESEALAARARPDSGVYLVPAFTGLGAPYWDAGARGALYGLTRDSGPAHMVRAAIKRKDAADQAGRTPGFVVRSLAGLAPGGITTSRVTNS